MVPHRAIAIALTISFPFALLGGVAAGEDARSRYESLFREGLAKLERRDLDGAIGAFERAIAIDPERPEAYYNIACAHALRGAKDEAIDWLSRSIARGFKDRAHIDRDPDLDAIRDDARFRDLLARAFAAPAGKLFTLEGTPASLEPLAGKVVVYFLWRTWAEPCREVAPALAELRRAYAKRGLEVVAISDEPARDQERVADLLKLNFVLLRSEGPPPVPELAGAGDVFPAIVIVGRDGKVAERLVGVRAKERLAEVVNPLLEAAAGEKGREPRMF